MPFLPIVERELRVAARRRATHWLRLFVVLAAVTVWFALLVAMRRSLGSVERALMLFHSVGVLALAASLVAGVFLTADSLSEERREGTLGLLFLTDLRGHDVVLGKLIATSLHAFYALLAILPLLAAPLLLGGVTVGEFWRVTLVLIASLFLSLSIGMVVSAFTLETRQAMATTLLIIIGLAGVLPMFWWLQRIVFGQLSWDLFLWPSPAYLYGRALDSYYRSGGGPTRYLTSLLTIVGLGIAALVTASVRLPRAWQVKAELAAKPPKERCSWRFGSKTFQAARRARLETNPFYWLASRDRRPGFAALAITGIALLIWLVFLALTFSSRGSNSGASLFIAVLLGFCMHAFCKVLIAIEASRRLSEDRLSGALELLLVTPLPVRQILEGQRRALVESFRWPMLLVLLTNALLFGRMLAEKSLRSDHTALAMTSEFIAGGALMMLTDAYAITWLGMWLALRARKQHRAIFGTLARVLLGPWLGFIILYAFAVGSASTATIEVGAAVWFGLAALLDAVLAGRARADLMLIRRNLAKEG